MSGEEVQVILIMGMVALAILTVEVKDIMHAVMCFGGMALVLGTIYFTLNAPFVAVFQVLVYTTAIIALFIFTIMLVTRRKGSE